jgi:hypothetical protein
MHCYDAVGTTEFLDSCSCEFIDMLGLMRKPSSGGFTIREQEVGCGLDTSA